MFIVAKNLFLGGCDVNGPKGIKCKNNVGIMHKKENGISIDHTNFIAKEKCDALHNPPDLPYNSISKDNEEGNMINARINYIFTVYFNIM